jgi:hypothetical protein
MTRQFVPELDDLLAELQSQYIEVRVLSDGSIAALHDLIFTRAILLGCDRLGFSTRFCFEDRDLATKRFHELQTEDDTPEGYIATRR